MKYKLEMSNSNNGFVLYIDQFDSNLRIDMPYKQFIFVEKIIFNNSNFNITFKKDPKSELFHFLTCNRFEKHLNSSLILEDLYLWIRSLESKYYGEYIFNNSSSD